MEQELQDGGGEAQPHTHSGSREGGEEEEEAHTHTPINHHWRPHPFHEITDLILGSVTDLPQDY